MNEDTERDALQEGLGIASPIMLRGGEDPILGPSYFQLGAQLFAKAEREGRAMDRPAEIAPAGGGRAADLAAVRLNRLVSARLTMPYRQE